MNLCVDHISVAVVVTFNRLAVVRTNNAVNVGRMKDKIF